MLPTKGKVTMIEKILRLTNKIKNKIKILTYKKHI